MLKHFLTGALVIGMVLPLATTPAHADKEDMGTLLGAGLGGLLGSQFGGGEGQLAATGLGVFLGGLTGRSMGQSLDRADHASYGYGGQPVYQERYQTTTYYRPNYVAPPVQVVRAYPDRGWDRRHHRHQPRYAEPVYYEQNTYIAAPAPAQQCREFTNTVQIGNRWQESYGTACLQPDGSWKIVR